jgi:SHO1 osmosensor
MPFKGYDSPSLQKMDMNNGRFGGEKKGFNFANIAGDPFSLATIGIALVGIHPMDSNTRTFSNMYI